MDNVKREYPPNLLSSLKKWDGTLIDKLRHRSSVYGSGRSSKLLAWQGIIFQPCGFCDEFFRFYRGCIQCPLFPVWCDGSENGAIIGKIKREWLMGNMGNFEHLRQRLYEKMESTAHLFGGG